MRDFEEIKRYWNDMQRVEHLGALSGCEYQGTIDFLEVTNLLKKGDKVLEIGVGLGYVTKGFRDNGMDVSALDISENALERVKEYCEGTYSVAEIEKLPSDYFDVIICHNGIQHIPTYLLEKELPHIIRSLKPTGVFSLEFVSTTAAEDTGIEIERFINKSWDQNIGCYCRTPKYLEELINRYGGKCKLVHDDNRLIEPTLPITGCHIFHVTK